LVDEFSHSFDYSCHGFSMYFRCVETFVFIQITVIHHFVCMYIIY